MICIGVFDTNAAQRDAIRQLVLRYSMSRDCDLDVMWFKDKAQSETIEKYASFIHMAVISLDCGGERAGRTISRINEDCRILYYSQTKTDLAPLLAARPRYFSLTDYDETQLFDTLDSVIAEISASEKNFVYETRKELLVIPYKKILYFQSNLKYVTIKTGEQETEIYAKLGDIETKLPSTFLRVHKSYLINTGCVRAIDKSAKQVILNSGERIPISDACYKQTLFRLQKIHQE